MATKQILAIDDLRKGAEALTQPKWAQTKIDLSMDVPEPIPVLLQGDCAMFTRGNISTLGGRPKSRKSFLVARFAADFLQNSDDGKVLLVDTEMALAHTHKTARRIHRLMNWDTHSNNDRLSVLSLREYAAADRVAIFTEAIEAIKPELVFLDGVRDMVKDFNNIEESTTTVGLLMKLSSQYDCHICSVLHENKGNGQLRGHLGAEVLNKSETILGITNNGDTSTVEAIYMRELSFEAFTFRVDDFGLPEYCDAPTRSVRIDKLKESFAAVLPYGVTLPYGDLRSKLMEYDNIKVSAAQIRIKTATDANIIVKSQSGYYFPSEKPDENTLPF